MTETRVWITQYLCPAHHCIMAAAAEAKDEQEARRLTVRSLRKTVDGAIKAGLVNPRCGICHAPQSAWKMETGRTAFRSMEEAAKPLLDLQAANLRAADLYGTHGKPH
jgi:hypothetical protein